MKFSRQGRNFLFYQAYEQLMSEFAVQLLTRAQLACYFSRFKKKHQKLKEHEIAFEFCKQRIRKLGENSLKRIKSAVWQSYCVEDNKKN